MSRNTESDDEESSGSVNEDELKKPEDEKDDELPELEKETTRSTKVEYCPVCTFPFEYCEYAGMMEKCKPHLMEWMKRTSQAPDCDAEAEISLEDKVKPKKKVPEGVEKMLPGGKVKKKEESIVLITVASRQKRKCVTTVTGLEHFGVKLADAAKEFKKMFSCGASVVKTPSGKEQIDIQGEFRDQLLEMWTKKFKEIPKESVFTMDEGKSKVPAFD
eukprot:EG_transcript_19031